MLAALALVLAAGFAAERQVRPGGAAWAVRLLTLAAAAPVLRIRRPLRGRDAELARLGLALDASKVGVWDFDIGRGELVWDARMDTLYGYPPAGGRADTRWRARLHPDDAARAEAEFRDAATAGGRYASDFRVVLPDGTLRHVRAVGAVCPQPDGARMLGVSCDVTAEAERAAALDARRRDAEAASRAKSQFLATMSHEIRTPMNGVIGMLDLILRSEPDPGQRERVAIARTSALHLLAILNDILDHSKLEANRITLEAADANVHRLARDVVALMAAGAGDRAVEVAAEIAPEVPVWLVCDATRLRQVLMNLVGNGVKFTEAGRVELRLGYARGRLEVAVRDTGVGIPEAARARLFQRFAQVDPASPRGGTGLGLAISRELVELMGGEIAVESAPGVGSTFRFSIPAPAGGEPAAEQAASPLPAPLPPRRVLVAEDNATNRQILAAYLGMGGHEVRMVTNGREALAEVQRGGFDLVIMDVQMPLMDGITAARRIRALDGPGSAIPIVALTANAMHGDREHCLAAGMTDYVSKPVSVEALYGAIARCCAYSSVTGTQPSSGSKLSMAAAAVRVSSPRSAS
jgi:signal transduction histidine kinase/ActR/RegA family two-component response regulator